MFQSAIVEKCKANDRTAQMQLYRKYCDGMYIVAMRFVKNGDDAEDILQESFIKAFQKIHQFKGDVTFGAWLKRIVVNKSIDFLKSKIYFQFLLCHKNLKIAKSLIFSWLCYYLRTIYFVKNGCYFT